MKDITGTIMSTNNKLSLRFFSDGSETFRGFNATYWPCKDSTGKKVCVQHVPKNGQGLEVQKGDRGRVEVRGQDKKTTNNTKTTTLHSNNINTNHIHNTPKPMSTHFTRSNHINLLANPIRRSTRLQNKSKCKQISSSF